MKKLIFTVLFISILLLSACQGDTTSESGVHNSQSGLTKSMFTKEEYETFTSETTLPNSFVYYSDLAVLGEFDGLVYDSSDPENLVCTYRLVDSNTFKLGVDIHYSGRKDNDSQLLSLPADISNMLSLGNTYDSYQSYTRGDVTYRYAKDGSLYDISWSDGKITFAIHGSGTPMSNYPLDAKETIVSRLLSIDENVSKAAFEELKAYMKANS